MAAWWRWRERGRDDRRGGWGGGGCRRRRACASPHPHPQQQFVREKGCTVSTRGGCHGVRKDLASCCPRPRATLPSLPHCPYTQRLPPRTKGSAVPRARVARAPRWRPLPSGAPSRTQRAPPLRAHAFVAARGSTAQAEWFVCNIGKKRARASVAHERAAAPHSHTGRIRLHQMGGG